MRSEMDAVQGAARVQAQYGGTKCRVHNDHITTSRPRPPKSQPKNAPVDGGVFLPSPVRRSLIYRLPQEPCPTASWACILSHRQRMDPVPYPRCLLIALGFLFVGASTALGQVHTGRPEFEAGRTYFDAQDYERALQAFQRSYKLSKQPTLFYNFALCYDRLGNPHRALEYLDRYLAEVTKVGDRREAQARRKALKERIDTGQRFAPAWVLLPTGIQRSDTRWIDPTLQQIRSDLVGRGETVWEPSTASDRYESVGSSPAPEITQQQIDAWVARSKKAIRSLARARYSRAHQELAEAQSVADKAAVELNREAAQARQVLDTCLDIVRAYLETKKPVAAQTQARACRRQIPGIEPTTHRHTPDVRALLAEIDIKLAAEKPGALTIDSTPNDCVVRVNGIDMGTTPLTLSHLPMGSYRLQVECDHTIRARVHRVVLNDRPATLHIDTQLDRAIQSRPSLRLMYEDVQTQDLRRADDGKLVANQLSATSWLLLSQPEPQVLRIDRRDLTEPERRVSAWLPMQGFRPDAALIERALDTLLSNKSVDLTQGAPIERAAWKGSGEGRSHQSPKRKAARKKRIAGYALLSAGVASLGVGTAMLFVRRNAGDDFSLDPADPGKGTRWKNLRLGGIWLPTGVGMALSISAMPLILPEKDKTPWWAWLGGGVGVGLLGYSVAQVATLPKSGEQGCGRNEITATIANVDACINRARGGDRAWVAAMGAAPLLTIPLVYLLRSKKIGVTPSLQVDKTHTTLQMQGTF